MPTRTAIFDGFQPFRRYGFLSVPAALYGARMRMKRIKFGSQSCLTSVRRNARLPTGKSQPVAAGLAAATRRDRGGVVDELVVGQVLQAIMLRAAVQREHAQQIRRQVVEAAVAEQDVMHRLVGQTAQLVLSRADQEDGQQPTGTSHNQDHPIAARYRSNQTAPPMTTAK